MRILVIEDEKDLADSIIAFISNESIFCDAAADVREAERLLYTHQYDFVLVDIMLPDGNGIDLINVIKKIDSRCGIIVISAKGALEDKLRGFEIGVDDYLTKPFHLAELNARIKTIIRRKDFNGNKILKINELSIDIEKRELFVNGTNVELTKREYDVFQFFISNKDRVVTKESIIEHVWGDDSNSFDDLNFVYTHIKNLRKKIKDAKGNDYLKSVYGIGYKFTIK